MTCGKCGAVNALEIAGARKAAEEDAARITDADLAERARAAARVVIVDAVPPAFQRGALAALKAGLANDAVARKLAERVLSVLLAPAPVEE